MNRWLVRFITRAIIWTLLGGICTACIGALCGVTVGAIIFPTPELESEVSYVAGCVGVVTGGLPGLITYFVLNFLCSAKQGFFRPPLFFVFVGMAVGAGLGLLVASIFALFPNVSWLRPVANPIVNSPIGMVLGQIAGAICTALVSERNQHQRELARWKNILESDYDLPYAHRSR